MKELEQDEVGLFLKIKNRLIADFWLFFDFWMKFLILVWMLL